MSDDNPPKIQRLPALELTTCEKCGARVKFRFHASRNLDANRRVVYLRCPECGASATQVQEIERPPSGKRRRVKFKYVPSC